MDCRKRHLSFLCCVSVVMLLFVMFIVPLTVSAAELDTTTEPISYAGEFAGPVIIIQPHDQFIFVLDDAYFSVNATGDNLSYVWQYRRPAANESWYNVSLDGRYNSVLTVPGKLFRNGYQYRCRITDQSGNVVYTEIATLYIYEQSDLSSVASKNVLSSVFDDILSVLPVLIAAVVLFIALRNVISFVFQLLRRS